MLVDEARSEAGGVNAVAIHFAEGDDRVLGLRVKWVSNILRVGLKTEELASALGPGEAFGARVSVDTQGFGRNCEIAKTMKDGPVPIDLHPLENVGVVSNHHIGSPIQLILVAPPL